MDGDRNKTTANNARLDSERLTRDVLDLLINEHHSDIVARRLGLFGRREACAAIASSFGVTRQAVQQFVALDIQRLSELRNKAALRIITWWAEGLLIQELRSLGDVARASDLTALFGSEQGAAAENRITFLAAFCPALVVITDDTKHYSAVGLSRIIDKQALDALIGEIIAALAHAGAPLSSTALARQFGRKDDRHIAAVASVSKELRQIDDLWGLAAWPSMDARFIQGRIYAVLKRHRTPMHFTAIADAVNADGSGHMSSDGVINNTLNQNPTFVRVGRGLYALAEEGYDGRSGTELIAEVLHEAGRPLIAAEIVERVHTLRPYLKKASIQQYLIDKPQFRRVRPNTYELADGTSEDATPHAQQ